jgi:hypothetical protein
MPNYTVKRECQINGSRYFPGQVVSLTVKQADHLFQGGALVDANATTPAPTNPLGGIVDAAGFHCRQDGCVNGFRVHAGTTYGTAAITQWLLTYTVAQINGFVKTLQAAGMVGAIGNPFPGDFISLP